MKSRGHLITGMLLLAACESSPFDGRVASHFSATLGGAVEAQYEGTGEFHTGTPAPGRRQFQITSQGNEAQRNRSFSVTRWDGARLPRGTYAISLVNLPDYARGATVEGRPEGITLQYFQKEGGVEEQFVAESGELHITESSSARVEGRFVFTGFRYCMREIIRSNPPQPPVGPCTLPGTPLTNAPRIHVSGTFVAIPLEVTGTILE